ncbi:MAG: GTP cyclohydrolase II [Alphaproteobacteria bacterium]
MTDTTADEVRQRRRVDRAIAELRRGVPVVLRGADGACVMLAAETASPPAYLDCCQALPAAPVLALTAQRGAALRIRPSGHDPLLVELPDWLDLDTVQSLADATTDLANPLRGPLERQMRAPTAAEFASIQLSKHARLLPAAILWPLDGEIDAFAAENDLLTVESDAVATYERVQAAALVPVGAAPVPLADAVNSRIVAYRPADGGIEHLAIVIGQIQAKAPVLVRLHSECFTGDLLGSLKCDCGEQLRGAIAAIEAAGSGIVLYLAQEGRGIGLINKLRAYRLQADGFDTVDANLRLGFEADERLFEPAAAMLRQLGVGQVRLLTNNPDKVAGLEACGIGVVERVAHSFPSNPHNAHYLATKQTRSGHLF